MGEVYVGREHCADEIEVVWPVETPSPETM
jgi:hypothetical protein